MEEEQCGCLVVGDQVVAPCAHHEKKEPDEGEELARLSDEADSTEDMELNRLMEELDLVMDEDIDPNPKKVFVSFYSRADVDRWPSVVCTSCGAEFDQIGEQLVISVGEHALNHVFQEI